MLVLFPTRQTFHCQILECVIFSLFKFETLMPVVCLCLVCLCYVMSWSVCVCVFVCTCVCVCSLWWSPPPHLLRSSYKDCNTLHLPMERFSPVRRFSDGAATIQAFKAHLENSSLIKQLKQVHHGSAQYRRPPGGKHQQVIS